MKKIPHSIQNRFHVSNKISGMIEAVNTQDEAQRIAKNYLKNNSDIDQVDIFDTMAKEGSIQSWSYVTKIIVVNLAKRPVMLKPIPYVEPEITGYEVTVWAGDNPNLDVDFLDGGKTKATGKEALRTAIAEYPSRDSTLYAWYSDGSKMEIIEYTYETKVTKNIG